MGALIFLLIVTTRRIRTEALAKAVAAREEKAREGILPPKIVRPELPLMMPAQIEPESNVVGPIPPKPPERIEPIPGLVVLGPSQSEPVMPPPRGKTPSADPKPVWPSAVAQKPPRNDPNTKLRATRKSQSRPRRAAQADQTKRTSRRQTETASRQPHRRPQENQFGNRNLSPPADQRPRNPARARTRQEPDPGPDREGRSRHPGSAKTKSRRTDEVSGRPL